ncbi:hypothetical protein [Streptomyces alfalfae]
MTMLPPAPPGVVPYVTSGSEERLLSCTIIRRPAIGGLAYADETPYDRDSFGVLWVRPRILPKTRRGEPRLSDIHAYRQRRAMNNMLCQVCAAAPEDPDAPQLFVLRDTSGPIREGERTASPPLCVPCAGIAVQECHVLRGGRWVAAWARSTPAYGVYGMVHDTQTLQPIPGRYMELVEYGSPLSQWTVAARVAVELHGVRPAYLELEWAAMGRDRLEAEFARVAQLSTVS